MAEENSKLYGLEKSDLIGSFLSGVDTLMEKSIGEEALVEANLAEKFFGRVAINNFGVMANAIAVIPAVKNLENGNYNEAGKMFSGLLVGTVFGDVGATVAGATTSFVVGGLASVIEGAEIGAEVGALAGPVGAAVGGLLGTAVGTALGYWEWEAMTSKDNAGDGSGSPALAATSVEQNFLADTYYSQGTMSYQEGFSNITSSTMLISPDIQNIFNILQPYAPNLSLSSTQQSGITYGTDGSVISSWSSGSNGASSSLYNPDGSSIDLSIYVDSDKRSWDCFFGYSDGSVHDLSMTYWNNETEGTERYISADGSVESLDVLVFGQENILRYKKVNVDGSSESFNEDLLTDGSYYDESDLIVSNSGTSELVEAKLYNGVYEYTKSLHYADGSTDVTEVYQQDNILLETEEIHDANGTDETISIENTSKGVDTSDMIIGSDGYSSHIETVKSNDGDYSIYQIVNNADGSGESYSLLVEVNGYSTESYSKTEENGSSFGKSVETFADGSYVLNESTTAINSDGSRDVIELEQSSDGSEINRDTRYSSDGTIDRIVNNSYSDGSSDTTETVEYADGSLEQSYVGIDSNGDVTNASDVKVLKDGSEQKIVFSKTSVGSVEVVSEINADGSSDVNTIISNNDGSSSVDEVVTYFDKSIVSYSTYISGNGLETIEEINKNPYGDIVEDDVKYYSEEGVSWSFFKESTLSDGVEFKYENRSASGEVSTEDDIDYSDGGSKQIFDNKSADGTWDHSEFETTINDDGSTDSRSTSKKSDGSEILQQQHMNSDGSYTESTETITPVSVSGQTVDLTTVDTQEYTILKNGERNLIERFVSDADGGYSRYNYYYNNGNYVDKIYSDVGGTESLEVQDIHLSGFGRNYVDFSFDSSGMVGNASGVDSQLYSIGFGVYNLGAETKEIDGDGTPVILNGANFDGVLNAANSDAVLIAGTGNVSLVGGEKNTTYYFSANFGRDVVDNKMTASLDAVDSIVFGNDINIWDVSLKRVGSDLFVYDKDGSIDIENEFINDEAGARCNIGQLNFIDGSGISTWLSSDDSYGFYVASSDGSNAESDFDGNGNVTYKSYQDPLGNFVSDSYQNGQTTEFSRDVDGAVSYVVKNANGDSHALTSDGGNVSLIGANGAEYFVIGEGSGETEIEDNVSNGGTDSLLFVNNVDVNQLWFEKNNNDLVINVIGTSDVEVIKDWYQGASHQVASIVSGNGAVLLASQVDNLVSAMSAFNPPAAGQTTLPTDYQSSLNAVIAANWH
jgi:hypothetical protein